MPESTAIKEIHREAETLAATTCSKMATTPGVPPESTGEDELKIKRAGLRRKVSRKCIAIENLMAKGGSRTLIREYMAELRTLLTTCNEVNEKVCDLYATDTKFEEQELKQGEYRVKAAYCLEAAQAHLEERKDDAASIVPLPDHVNLPTPVMNTADNQATENEPTRPQNTWREMLNQEGDMVEQLRAWTERQQRGGRQVEEWVERDRGASSQTVRNQTVAFPDDWIDDYVRRSDQAYPRHTERNHRGPVSLTLETYEGNTMKWLEWISLFKALVHDAGQSPAEKLAILKHNLKRDCKKLAQGFGVGEPESKEALRRLKQECGQRDVMRIEHLQKLNTLHPGKGDVSSLRKFAEDAKSHLFDFGQ